MTGLPLRATLGLALFIATSAAAGAADDFRGKTINFIAPVGIGGVYGIAARGLADHMPAHLPGGPTGVAQYMPGAGGLKQANYLFNAAPKDGSAIGVLSDNTPTSQLLQAGPGVKFDSRKFGILGTINKGEVGVLGMMKSAGLGSIDEARTKVVALGATGVGSGQYIVPNVMNKLLGTKFKLVAGYKGSPEIFLALEQGELGGLFSNVNAFREVRPEWVASGRLVWIAQLNDRKDPDFPTVPLLQDLAKNPRDRAAFEFLARTRTPGKIVVAPPGLPAALLAALRDGFARTMRDAGFVADVRKGHVDVDPRSWQGAATLVRETVETPADIVDYVRALTKTGK